MSLTVTSEIAAFLKKKDAVLGSWIDRLGLLDIETSGNVFRDLVSCIIGQMISTKAAATIEGRLIALVGDISPASIEALKEADIRPIGVSARKAHYIRGLAVSVHQGTLSFDHLAQVSDERILKELMAIDGIGRWSAEMIAMFTLGREDIFSYDDLALRQGIVKVHHLKTIDKKLFDRYRRRYHPYASYAALYYYHAYDGKAK